MDSAQGPSSHWFEYPVRVQPHHTDYARVVWHGSYLEWMEDARIAMFRSVGVEYADLVKLGCDLPVIDLSLRYQKVMKLGEVATVKSRISKFEKVRLCLDQHIFSVDAKKPNVVGEVMLVPCKSDTGQILRRPPQILQDAIENLLS